MVVFALTISTIKMRFFQAVVKIEKNRYNRCDFLMKGCGFAIND
jgi:hypothetical protein